MRSRCVIFSISKFCKYFSANVRYKMQEVVRRCQEAARSRVLSPISRHKNIILEPDSAAGHILVIGAGAGWPDTDQPPESSSSLDLVI